MYCLAKEKTGDAKISSTLKLNHAFKLYIGSDTNSEGGVLVRVPTYHANYSHTLYYDTRRRTSVSRRNNRPRSNGRWELEPLLLKYHAKPWNYRNSHWRRARCWYISPTLSECQRQRSSSHFKSSHQKLVSRMTCMFLEKPDSWHIPESSQEQSRILSSVEVIVAAPIYSADGI